VEFIRDEKETHMYCSSCGQESPQELNYCNRCGANLNLPVVQEKSNSTASVLILTLVIGLLTIFGLVAIMEGLSELKNGGFSEGIMGMFMLFSFVILGTIDILLVRQLSHLLSAPRQPRRALAPRQNATRELGAPTHAGALREPVASVTENTTRTFEPSYREPRTRTEERRG
jgi:hypothetical protein